MNRGSSWGDATEADVASFLDLVTSKVKWPETTIKGAMSTILALYEGSEISAPISHSLFARLRKGFIVLHTTRDIIHRPPILVDRVVEWIKTLSSNTRLSIYL
jgi:hypothetical protein